MDNKTLKKIALSYIKTPLIFALIGSSTAALVSVLVPFVLQILVDYVFTGLAPQMFTPLISVLFGASAIILALYICRKKLSNDMKSSLFSEFGGRFINSLSYNTKMSSSEMISRWELVENFSHTITESIISLYTDIFMLLFYGIIMARYSGLMTLIVILLCVMNIMLIFISYKVESKVSREYENSYLNLTEFTVGAVGLAETVKASGSEENLIDRYNHHLDLHNKVFLKYTEKTAYTKFFQTLISGITNILILASGAYFIIKGNLTVGSLLGFQAIVSMFLEPVNDLGNIRGGFNLLASFEENLTMLKSENRLTSKEETEGKFLFSMGTKVAVIGESGSRKDKYLNDLYEKLKNDKDVIFISGNPFMLECSIHDNIQLWDESVTRKDVFEAAKACKIHNDILSKPSGYGYICSSGGRNLSGGQCQRIALARGLARSPKVLILDNVTSALDKITEINVINNLLKMNCTIIFFTASSEIAKKFDKVISLERERGVLVK